MSKMNQSELTDFIHKKIYHWVGKNFGSQEAEDPSWDITQLSSYLGNELGKVLLDTTELSNYELTVLAKEGEGDVVAEKVEGLITDNGGVVVKKEFDGRKRLAYSINGHDFAEYIYFEVKLDKNKAPSVSSVLNLDDDILRYLMLTTNRSF